jgi:alpha-glucosidase
VALPAGRWFAWRPLPAADGSPAAPEATALEGGRTLVLDAPAGQGVLAVAEGTVLPLDDGWAEPAGAAEGGDQGRLDAEHGVRVLGLHCFATGDGRASGTHYDDAGDGYGESRLDRFELAPDPDRGWTLTWTSEGPFPRPLRVRVVLHGVAATAATADGTDVIVQAGQATVVETGPFERLRLT